MNYKYAEMNYKDGIIGSVSDFKENTTQIILEWFNIRYNEDYLHA